HVRGYGSPLQLNHTPLGDQLVFLAEDRGRVRLCATTDYDQDLPKFTYLTDGDVVVEAFEGSNQHFVTIMATPTSFADIYTFPLAAPAKRLTNVNPQTKHWKLPQLSVVSWKGAGGQTVEGILELPPDYKKGDKVPLVVEIHGGPTTATYFKLQYWIYGRTLLP